MTSEANQKNNLKQNKPKGLEIFLNSIAIAITISIFLKALIDVDTAYDTWGYHLPFAARIWNIVPAEQYVNKEAVFAGFPLFAEFLQGFFWFITNHLQSANLVSFFSIVLYGFFLRSYFRVPLYLSTFSFLAIPLVLTHTTSCYVDLPGNIALAIAIMMTYVIYKQQEFPKTRDIIIIVLAAAVSSNTKLQLEPLVFVVLFFVVVRILWLRFHRNNIDKAHIFHGKFFLKAGAITFLASLLIFATPIKNIALFGNPFYPVRIEIAGHVLNHKTPLYNDSPGYLSDAPRAQRWLYSILEIKAAPWSFDQWSKDPDRNRMGGFFGAYVVFQLLLFSYLLILYRDRQTYIGAAVLLVMSVVAANFPQSHELRYFMYWMICLVSINLYLVSRTENQLRTKLVNPGTLGLVSLFALAIVVAKTNFFYIKPEFLTLNKFLGQLQEFPTYRETLATVQPNDKICLINKSNYTVTNNIWFPASFTYTPWFNPQLDYTYSIQFAYGQDSCQPNRKILVLDE